MIRMVDIPAWMVDVLEGRAKAAGTSFEEALIASLDIRTPDLLVETVGWAAKRGIPQKKIAARSAYSRRRVEDAAREYRGR